MSNSATTSPAATEYVDERYYEVAQPRSLGERVVIAARDRIYQDFLKDCEPKATDTILDIGVSDVINDAANVLERRYAHASNITAAGLGEGGDFKAEFKDINYVQIEAGKPLPFADKVFDIATSNAVLEHVGSTAAQCAFIAEHMRVARLVYITVPHRFFPIEHHTAIPFAHWNDKAFELACRMTGKTSWTDRENLILMSRSWLSKLVPPRTKATIRYTGLNLGLLSSNLALIIDQRQGQE
ncbi:MAG: methyltransferase domain-containing protein [Pseudomonadota bacterium]